MRKIQTFLLTLCVAGMLCGCGGTGEDTLQEADNDVVEEKVVATAEIQPIETEVQEETDEGTTAEVAAETTSEKPQTIKQWAKSIDRTEPKLTIWNNDTKEGTILENGGEYTVKMGDQLILCYEGEETFFTTKTPILTSDISSTIYRIIDILEQPTKPTEVEFSHMIDGIEYVYKVILVSEEAKNPFESEVENQILGKEWAASLGYEYPKLVVWNDEQNTKVEIEEGQEYTMQPGDVLAVYSPENYIVQRVIPEIFLQEFIPGNGYCIIKCVPQENSEPVDFLLEGMLGTEIHQIRCTLIPATE